MKKLLIGGLSSVGLEHLPCTQGVKGSNPLDSTKTKIKCNSAVYNQPDIHGGNLGENARLAHLVRAFD